MNGLEQIFTEMLNNIDDHRQTYSKPEWTNKLIVQTWIKANEHKLKNLFIPGVSQQRELLDDKKCDKLIHELDNYARNYDNYDYGLPTGVEDDDPQLKEMRLLVKNWVKANCG